MLGAIIGDIVGSRFEFLNHRSEQFELLSDKCFFTDDTVMTCALASVLGSSDLSKENIVATIKRYGRGWPHAGYGGRFGRWIFSNDDKPYYSFGNGAAMRISSVGWIAKNKQEVKTISRILTEVTHDHPEGLKGAEVTAMCIFMARNGKSKEEIKEYVKKEYPKIDFFKLGALREFYKFNETCQESVPQAIFCFLESNSFEDCLRKTVSIGGDSDTLCAISGAIAEAFYGIPEQFKKEILKYFKEDEKRYLLIPIKNIYTICGKKDYFEL